jgi:Flp pilus assembly protein TadB
MTAIGSLVALALIAAVGISLIVGGWLQPAPSLSRTLQHLQRRGLGVVGDLDGGAGSRHRRRTAAGRFADQLVEMLGSGSNLLPSDTQLRLVGRPVEQHVLYRAGGALAGFVVPTVVVAVLQRAGVLGFGWYVPLIAGVLFAALGPLVVHTATVERAQAVRSDMRYQVSAYLDLVTMLLAGNTGHEGALEQAARAGDGRMFAELRRRIRESAARGESLTAALDRAGKELGLDELEQIASTAALSAAEGAPVARTLAAKCATMRAALSGEQETEARLRTSRLTTPIVGMALIFMALVMYPALTFT